MLSAQELVTQSTKISALPVSGGAKGHAPESGNEEQDKLLKDTLKQYEDLIKEERICRKLNLSVADWDDERNLGVVNTIKGIHFHKFGHTTKEGTFLLPEETLFLIDQGALELKHNSLPLSLCEAYILLLPLLPSIEYYQVYSFLCKLGFVVTRYTKSQHCTLQQSTSKWGKCPHSPTSSSEDDHKLKDETFEPMVSGYVKNLWHENEKPCLKSQDATRSAAVLSKLQIINIKLFRETQTEDENSSYNIDLNVYQSKDVKKSNLGSPIFRIIVCRYTDYPPSLMDIVRLSNESAGINLKLGLVNQGTVSFYGMFEVDLPTLLSPLG